MEPKRIIALSYLAFAFVGGIVLTNLATSVFDLVRINNRNFFEVEELSIASLVGFGIAIAAVGVAWRHPTVSALSYEVAGELKKVTWPSLAEIRVSTGAVLIASAVCAVVLGVVYDVLASKVMTEWIPVALNWISARG